MKALVPARVVRALVIPAVLLVVAEVAVRAFMPQSDALAAPSAVISAWMDALERGVLVGPTLQTLGNAFAGLLVGGGVGLVVGLLLGLWSAADRLLAVTIECLRPVPPVALIPLALLIFGFGYRMEIAVIAFATAWPALTLTRSAVKGIAPGLMEVARVLQLDTSAMVRKIVLPAVMPQLFVALRLCLGIALIVAVTVEISVNSIGLGHDMMAAQQSLNAALMLAYLGWIGALGYLMNAALVGAQGRLFGQGAGSGFAR